MLERHLALAERHVALGEGHLTRQRQVIVQLKQAGQDATGAIKLLRNLEEAQELHIADRDRLKEQLAAP